jgi:hypothetical protein
MIKQKLLAYLKACCRGKAGAATREQLRIIIGCDDRKIRETIAELRISGVPIAAKKEAPGGYFIPLTREEAMESLYDWRQRAHKLYKAAAGYERGLRELFPNDQQMTLGLGQIVEEATNQNLKEAS